MNKVLKRISIAALGFLLIGTGLTVCGLLLGGTLGFSYTLGQPLNTDSVQDFHMVTEEIEAVHSIEVDTDYFDVRVIPGSTFSVTYPKGEYMDSVYKVDHDKLTLTAQEKEKSGIHIYGFGGIGSLLSVHEEDEENCIKVTVPQGTMLNDVVIHSGDGDCLIEGQSADSYALDLSYGDFTFTECSGADVEIKNGDGDVDIHACNFDRITGKLSYGSCNVDESVIGTGNFYLSDGSLNMENGSVSSITAKLSYGDCTIKHTKADCIDARLSDGDFKAKVDEAEELFSANLDTSFGDVTINGKEQGTNYSSAGSPDKTISVESSYGDINIEFEK